jgi:tetratricopeptide (TPR) repeat protein
MSIKAMQAAQKPPEVPEKTWKDYNVHVFATCYYVVGHAAFEQQDYNTAVANLENSLKHYGRNDRAYYYLGQAYWQQAKLDLAMKSFAKAYLLRGDTSAPSKQHLDNLYKSTHQNTLVGIERVIDKAKEELR